MIHVRTKTGFAMVTALSMLAGAAYLVVLPLVVVRRAACNPMPIARRAFKPTALWLNAALYKISEDQIDYARSVQALLYQSELQGGRDTAYFNRYRMNLSAREYRHGLWQRKLRARRDQINQW